MLLTIADNVIARSSRRSPVSRTPSRGRSLCHRRLLASVSKDLVQTFGLGLFLNGSATDGLCRPGTGFTEISERRDTHAEALSFDFSPSCAWVLAASTVELCTDDVCDPG